MAFGEDEGVVGEVGGEGEGEVGGVVVERAERGVWEIWG